MIDCSNEPHGHGAWQRELRNRNDDAESERNIVPTVPTFTPVPGFEPEITVMLCTTTLKQAHTS